MTECLTFPSNKQNKKKKSHQNIAMMNYNTCSGQTPKGEKCRKLGGFLGGHFVYGNCSHVIPATGICICKACKACKAVRGNIRVVYGHQKFEYVHWANGLQGTAKATLSMHSVL